ncbi:hypothetical protein ACFO9E_13045 [Streptomyces maoxianensis]|uniref:Uncharacterized protein n=1 Tax=Streptomyces maoxianensis TaxID=1459942 RepID=A0ABV9G6M6_9ACTN
MLKVSRLEDPHYDAREKTVQQIADLFGVPRSTVYGHLDKTNTVPRQPKKTVGHEALTAKIPPVPVVTVPDTYATKLLVSRKMVILPFGNSTTRTTSTNA